MLYVGCYVGQVIVDETCHDGLLFAVFVVPLGKFIFCPGKGACQSYGVPFSMAVGQKGFGRCHQPCA